MNTPISASTLSAWCREADAALQAHRWSDATELYRRVVSVDRTNANVWFNLAYALRSGGQFEEALAAYAHALSSGVADPQEVHLNRAAIYSDHLFQDDAAAAELRAAIALCEGYAPAWLNLGNLEEERGDKRAAIACYERVLQLDGSAGPIGATAVARLANLVPPHDPGDALMVRLEVLARAASDPEVRANLWFALGHAYERMSSFDLAFDAFEQANSSCRRLGPSYDRGSHERTVDALLGRGVAALDPEEDAGSEPLFICGMFRSGSTLLEQMLAGHPAITAAGELDWLPRLVKGSLHPFPWSLAAVPRGELLKFSRWYMGQLRNLPISKMAGRYITDKRPDNFMLIGLIKTLFPGAKILHTVRHPIDNGLSVYKQHLSQQAAPYSCDLEDIGHYYLQYRKVMAHWKSIYSSDILDIDYDALVRSPEEVLSETLHFLGLEWSPACLQFHQHSRAIKTASYWQVRRPLYGQASGRWRHYARRLGPLAASLQSAGVLCKDDVATLALAGSS